MTCLNWFRRAARAAVATVAVCLAGCAGAPAASDSSTPQGANRAHKGAQPDELPDIDIDYEKFVLGNGLTVLVHEDHTTPVVAVNTWYHVGAKDEQPGKTGFAHLFEHLMFQGSENYHGEFFEPLEKVGATDMNGTTNHDRTNYFETVPRSALDVALWMESDRMGHFAGAISQARLDEQRGVVQNEKRQGQNRPYGEAWRMISENTYPEGHPYSWSVIGSMDDLDAALLADVKGWFAAYYGASNAVVTLAGDITVEEARTKMKEYFGDIDPGASVPHRGAWVAKMDERKELTTYDQVPQARAMYVYNIPPYGAATTEYLRLAARLLAGGKTSRLYKRLVYEDELATTVDAWVSDGEIGSQLIIFADARAGVPLGTVQEALEGEVAALAADGPTEQELRRAKMSYFSETLSDLERVGGFGGASDRIARSETFLGDPGAFNELTEVLGRASAPQVRGAADTWLTDGVFVMRVLPDPNYEAGSAEETASRDHLPEAGEAPTLDLPELQRATLSNGLKVVVAQRRDVPVVRFRLTSNGGFAADPVGQSGTAALAMDVLDEGTDTYSSLELASHLEGLGASLSSGADVDESFVTMKTLATTVDPALDLLAGVVRHPAFSADEIERRRKKLLSKINREQARPSSHAQRLLGPLVYGDGHRYGIPLTGSGTAATVKALSRDDLVGYVHRQMTPKNSTLLVVGDTSLDAVKPKLEAHFGDWQASEGAKAAPASPKPRQQPLSHDAPRVVLIDKPGAEQSLIVTGNVFAERDQIDQIAVEAMNAAIGGVFSSRLNMNLREDKHWSYGALSFIFETRGKQLFATYANVQTDKTSPSMTEIKHELDAFVTNRPITADELQKIKKNKTHSLPGQNETTGRLADSINKILKFGLPDDYYDVFTEHMNELTDAQVKEAASEAIDVDATTWIVIGDLDRIEDDVRALDFGKVTVINDQDAAAE